MTAKGLRGIPLRRVMMASVAAICLVSFQAQAASVACFAPDDAKQARLRQMQQEFTVAALSCRTAPALHETMAERYNRFVGKFGDVLRENARALLLHFSHHGGSPGFDSWMTKLANAASEHAATEPDYCQRAWDNLERSMLVETANIAEFATATVNANELVPVCVIRRAQKHTDAIGEATPEQDLAAQ